MVAQYSFNCEPAHTATGPPSEMQQSFAYAMTCQNVCCANQAGNCQNYNLFGTKCTPFVTVPPTGKQQNKGLFLWKKGSITANNDACNLQA